MLHSVKKLPASAGDSGSIPRSGRSLGGGNGNPLQYSCLENSMDRGAWLATFSGVARVEQNSVIKPPPFSSMGLPRGLRGRESACQCSRHETRVSLLSFNLGEDPLEKEMATHSSILTRGITWTEEAAGLSPLGHKRVR